MRMRVASSGLSPIAATTSPATRNAAIVATAGTSATSAHLGSSMGALTPPSPSTPAIKRPSSPISVASGRRSPVMRPRT